MKNQHSYAQTQLVMLKKYYDENSPLKHSKEKFENLKKDYNILEKETKCLRSYNENLKQEVNNLTKSLLQSNEVITTVLSEIQNNSQNSMLSLHNLIQALEKKISLLLNKS